MNKKIVVTAASVFGLLAVGTGVTGWFVSDKAAHFAQENALEMLQTQYPAMSWTVAPSTITYFPWPAVKIPTVSGTAISPKAKVKAINLEDVKGSLEIGALNKSVPLSNVSVGHAHVVYAAPHFGFADFQEIPGQLDLNNVSISHFNKNNPKATFSGVLKDPTMMPLSFDGNVAGVNVDAIKKDLKNAQEWSLKGSVKAKPAGSSSATKPLELSVKLHSKDDTLYSDTHLRGDMASVKTETNKFNAFPDLNGADLTASFTTPLPEKLKGIQDASWKLVSFYGTIKSVQVPDLVSKMKQFNFAGVAKQMDELSHMFSDASLKDITVLTQEDRLRVKSSLIKSEKKQGTLELDSPLEMLNERNEIGALDLTFTGTGLKAAHYGLHTGAWENNQSEISFEFTLPEDKGKPLQLSNLWNISGVKSHSGNIQDKLTGQGKIQKDESGFEVNLDKIDAEINGAKIDGHMVASVDPNFSKLTGMTASFTSPQLYVTENSEREIASHANPANSQTANDNQFMQELVSKWMMTADKVRLDFKPMSLVFDEVSYHNPVFTLDLKDGKGKISVSDQRNEGPNLLADIEWDNHSKPTKWKLAAHPAMIPSSYLAYILGQPTFMQGAVYLTGNMEFTGYTEKQLMLSAKGNLGLAMHSGEIHRSAILPMLGKWGSFLSVLGDGKIPLKCAGAVTEWQAGHIKIGHLGLLSKHVSIAGDGQEDFTSQTLNLNVQPRVTMLGRSVSKAVGFESKHGHISVKTGAINKNFQLGLGGKAHESCDALFAESRLGEETKQVEKAAPGRSGFENILSGKS